MGLTWCWGLTFVIWNQLCSHQNTHSTDEKTKGQKGYAWGEADLGLETQEAESHLYSHPLPPFRRFPQSTGPAPAGDVRPPMGTEEPPQDTHSHIG